MSEPSKPVPDESPSARPLPGRTKLVVGILLAIPMIALALVPTYSGETPRLWGFPFFYWYQFLWLFLTAGFTSTAYVVINRARGGKR